MKQLMIEKEIGYSPFKPHESSMPEIQFLETVETRKANFFQQLYFLIKRNFIYTFRNPQGLRAMLIISIF